MAGVHTWISESSALDGSEPRYRDGWHDGVRDVAGYLLRIADTVATTGRSRAASIAMRLPHSQQPDAPTPTGHPAGGTGPAPGAGRGGRTGGGTLPWAVAAPEVRHWPDGEFLGVALSAVRPEERGG